MSTEPTLDELKRIAADAVCPGMRLDHVCWSPNVEKEFRAVYNAGRTYAVTPEEIAMLREAEAFLDVFGVLECEAAEEDRLVIVRKALRAIADRLEKGTGR